MESITRGLVVYLFLLLVFRLAGKRSLSETSSFDLVLLLIISETIQQAMVDSDNSLTNAGLLVLTLVSTDVFLSVVKQRSPLLDQWLEGVPVVVLKDGQLVKEHADSERVDEADILEAAREQRGLERLDQIKFAVLERGGKITVVGK